LLLIVQTQKRRPPEWQPAWKPKNLYQAPFTRSVLATHAILAVTDSTHNYPNALRAPGGPHKAVRAQDTGTATWIFLITVLWNVTSRSLDQCRRFVRAGIPNCSTPPQHHTPCAYRHPVPNLTEISFLALEMTQSDGSMRGQGLSITDNAQSTHK
jgi:hypothetical protein